MAKDIQKPAPQANKLVKAQRKIDKDGASKSERRQDRMRVDYASPGTYALTLADPDGVVVGTLLLDAALENGCVGMIDVKGTVYQVEQSDG